MNKKVQYSRHHRKGLSRRRIGQQPVSSKELWQSLWHPGKLNWWIGTVFACGSFLFILGGVFSLSPSLANLLGLDSSHINAIFFAGSIPFTTAAYLQLYQAANAHRRLIDKWRPGMKSVYFGWRPRDVGWLSCAIQFAGTLLFNLNTFDAMQNGLVWIQQDLLIWAPDMLGSTFFLLSGYLAFMEYCYDWWAWQPHELSWWITIINLAGCVAFMVSAIFAIVFPAGMLPGVVILSTVFTILGALCFFIGAVLLLPEAA